MQQKSQSSIPWYEKTWVVVLWCIFFFPVGLYALWKNSSIGNGWKVGVTVVFLLIVWANAQEIGKRKSPLVDVPRRGESIEEPTTLGESVTSNVEAEQIDAKTQEVIDKLKAKAKRDWPDDYTTQEYWVNQQLDDYRYMLTIEDNSIKRRAQRDWPLDFSTQKYWYNEQIEAKERLK